METFADPYRGWIPHAADGSDLLDYSGETFDAIDAAFGTSPRAGRPVSLRAFMPPIQNQGGLFSCTAHALAAALGFEHRGVRISRLQLFYLTRAYQGLCGQNVGAKLHDAVRAVRDHGIWAEARWPYDESRYSAEPEPFGSGRPRLHRIARYAPLKGGAEYRRCLEQGYPFIIGMRHTDAFWSEEMARTGILPMPGGQPVTHGHAVCVIGYSDVPQRAGASAGGAQGSLPSGLYYEVRNSVGPQWGDAGHFWAPAAYLEDPSLAGDAWTIRR